MRKVEVFFSLLLCPRFAGMTSLDGVTFVPTYSPLCIHITPILLSRAF